ncbi:hypothetical protein ACFVH4_16830 [Nocardia ignorata]|uniref:hypothetical protein n=1 Tax=Nocardia ignorata TaxID=145285 RepID=UPI003645172E
MIVADDYEDDRQPVFVAQERDVIRPSVRPGIIGRRLRLDHHQKPVVDRCDVEDGVGTPFDRSGFGQIHADLLHRSRFRERQIQDDERVGNCRGIVLEDPMHRFVR